MKYEIESAEQFIAVAEEIGRRYQADRTETAFAMIDMILGDRACQCGSCVHSAVYEANRWVSYMMEGDVEESHYFDIKDGSVLTPEWYELYLLSRKMLVESEDE